MLVLASTSPYRRELLARLALPFRTESPAIDETPEPGETPVKLAARLSLTKAQAVANRLSEAPVDANDWLIIGSDQVATLDGDTPLGKPGNHRRATAQLRAASGQRVAFHTGLAVVDIRNGQARSDVVTTTVSFRELSDRTIDNYLRAEQPYDCAGAAKSEGLGIALLSAVDGPDATALIGLPLIALCSMLIDAGCSPLGN